MTRRSRGLYQYLTVNKRESENGHDEAKTKDKEEKKRKRKEKGGSSNGRIGLWRVRLVRFAGCWRPLGAYRQIVYLGSQLEPAGVEVPETWSGSAVSCTKWSVY